MTVVKKSEAKTASGSSTQLVMSKTSTSHVSKTREISAEEAAKLGVGMKESKTSVTQIVDEG